MTKYALRKWLAGAAMLGAASAALTGCNGDDDGGPTTSPTATVTATATATVTATATPGPGGTPVASAFYPGTYTVRVTTLAGATSSFNFTVDSAGAIRSRTVSSGLGNGAFSGTVSPEGGLSATLAAQGSTVRLSGALPSTAGTASLLSATSGGLELPSTISISRQ